MPRKRSRFHLVLPPVLLEKLKELSEATGIPIARIVEQALPARIAQLEEQIARERAA